MAEKRSRGGQSTYRREIADEICARIAAGETLAGICDDLHMPPDTTVRHWVIDDVDGFAARYAQARDVGLDRMADEVLRISDTQVIGQEITTKADGGCEVKTADMLGHRRLQVDTRKWYLSKLAPKRYGDKLDVEVRADENLARLIIEGRRRLTPPEPDES